MPVLTNGIEKMSSMFDMQDFAPCPIIQKRERV